MNKLQKINDIQSQVIGLRFFSNPKRSQKEVSDILNICIKQVQRYEKKYKKNLT